MVPQSESPTECIAVVIVTFLLYVLFLLELEGENLVDDYCGGKLK